MGKSKKSKELKRWQMNLKEEDTMKNRTESDEVPIKNLPENFLCMRVKNGTKMRNVLDYALKKFPHHESVVWTGIGHCIEKVISCAELFKRKHEGLHQITKLRYIKTKRSEENIEEQEIQLPEIHILLTRDIKDTTELGYQAPGDYEEFPEKEDAVEPKTSTRTENASNATCIDTKEFATMGLRIGQKRKNRHNKTASSFKKNKTSKS
nr:PREDICTED: ribonuclease P protein subunit p25-like protein isoform X2 [Linepithema humile]